MRLPITEHSLKTRLRSSSHFCQETKYPDKFDKVVLIAIASKMDSSELEMAPVKNNSFESENKER